MKTEHTPIKWLWNGEVISHNLLNSWWHGIGHDKFHFHMTYCTASFAFVCFTMALLKFEVRSFFLLTIITLNHHFLGQMVKKSVGQHFNFITDFFMFFLLIFSLIFSYIQITYLHKFVLFFFQMWKYLRSAMKPFGYLILFYFGKYKTVNKIKAEKYLFA